MFRDFPPISISVQRRSIQCVEPGLTPDIDFDEGIGPMTCVACGAQLAERRTKFCSDPCASRYWQQTHVERQREANRRSYAKHRERVLRQRNTPEARARRAVFNREYRAANLETLKAAQRTEPERARRRRYMREYNARPEVKDWNRRRRRESRDERIATLLRNFRHRSPVPDAPYELIDPHEVFARDGWTCQLCGRTLDLEPRRRNDPDMATVDHIVPLCAGGLHRMDNVRAACLGCNAGASVSHQRALAPKPLLGLLEQASELIDGELGPLGDAAQGVSPGR